MQCAPRRRLQRVVHDKAAVCLRAFTEREFFHIARVCAKDGVICCGVGSNLSFGAFRVC